MRTIGVVGASFTGTTVPLLFVLDGAHAVFGAGETHWILDAAASFPLVLQDHSRYAGCRTCGVACPVWTPEFVAALQQDSRNWWSRIGMQAHADVVVTTDKVPDIFDRLGLPDQIILAWKDPRAWVVSWYLHQLAVAHDVSLETVRMPDEAIQQAKVWLVDFYRAAWAWVTVHYKCWTLFDLDVFVGSPEQELHRLCHDLGLAYNPAMLETLRLRTHHHIEGNWCAADSKGDYQRARPQHYLSYARSFGTGVAADLRWHVVLTAQQAAALSHDAELRELRAAFSCARVPGSL